MTEIGAEFYAVRTYVIYAGDDSLATILTIVANANN